MARRTKEVVEKPVEEVVEPVVEEKPKKTVKKTSTKKTSVKISFPRVNIRKNPDLSADVLNVAIAGDKFELISDEDEKFYEISFNGEKAFVMKDFAALV